MPRSTFDWNALRFVLSLARNSSLERAAAELGVDASTVSRRVRAFEKTLSARVFERAVSGHRLTAVGHRLLETAERVEGIIAAMASEVDHCDERPAGAIRIVASDAVSLRLLPLLAKFHLKHPLVSFEILANARVAEVVRGEADMALRFLRPDPASLASKRVAVVGQGLYASREYLSDHPFQPGGDQIRGHSLLGYDGRAGSSRESQWLDEHSTDCTYVLRANRVEVLVTAAVAGMGLAVLPCYLADVEPNLVCLLPPAQVLTNDLWIVLRRDSRHVARFRMFVEYLTETLRAAAPDLQGAGGQHRPDNGLRPLPGPGRSASTQAGAVEERLPTLSALP